MLRSPKRCTGVSFEPAPHLKPPVTQPRGSASVLLQGFHCSGSPSSLGLPFATSPAEETEADTVGIWACRGDGMLSPTCWPAAEGRVAAPASAVEVDEAGHTRHDPYLTSAEHQWRWDSCGDGTLDDPCGGGNVPIAPLPMAPLLSGHRWVKGRQGPRPADVISGGVVSQVSVNLDRKSVV